MWTLHRASAAVALACAAVLGGIGPRPAAAPVRYALIVDEVPDLGTLSGHTWSEAHAINETGGIAGTSASAAGTSRAVLWPSPTVPPGSLGHLGGNWSEAWGINDARQVVGNSRASVSGAKRGFLWTPSSGIEDLGLIGMTVGSSPVVWFTANDISNTGAIVGDFENWYGKGGYLAAIGAALVPFCPDGHGLRDSSAKAINDDGSFTGKVHCIGGPGPAPYQGNVSAFTTLTGYSEPNDQGYGINAAGRVVGGFVVVSTGADGGHYHAFRWSPAAGFTDIHPPDDTAYESVARGINKNGLIVGSKYTNISSSAFVYGQGIQMKTLPDICPARLPQSTAFAVNDSGWVVGGSRTCAGEYHATLWKVRVVVMPFPSAQ